MGVGPRVRFYQTLATWIGFGLQRHTNGGQNIRAIGALAAITGNVGIKGGGVYYYNQATNFFPLKLANHSKPSGSPQTHRLVDINNFARDLISLDDPPVKLPWVACRNPLSQDPEPGRWQKLLQRLELVVTVDLFMTRMAAWSDLVLPAATHFEDYDVNVSYWHY